MDQYPVQSAPSADEEDEWDTEGFVIPSLEIEDPFESKSNAHNGEVSKPSSPKAKKEASIYLGPHGAPPLQSKQQEVSSGGKQRFKQKLKEADKRVTGIGWENKVENLRELVGGVKGNLYVEKGGAPRDWLDPYCHESQFERRPSH